MYKKPLKIAIRTIFFLFLYLFLPVYLLLGSNALVPRQIFFFYLFNSLVLIYSFQRNARRKNELAWRTQNLQEEFNLAEAEQSAQRQRNLALSAKKLRYSSLKRIIEEISRSLNIESVIAHLTRIAFSVIANNKGVCLLYLVDREQQKLIIFKARKEDQKLIIKAKEGDVFDNWVLKRANPLMIENIKNDFRFDLEKLKDQDDRPFSSLIAAPFISKDNFLGILRLDHPDPAFYTQEDLRYLAALCDLGAVALENAQLFERTEALAIHDELTSLYTKGYFLECLQEEVKKALSQKRVFSLLMLDIDFFKEYNDKFGHKSGDIVLKNLSRRIETFLEKMDFIAGRFGGEEFAVILKGVDRKKAQAAAFQLRKDIAKERLTLRRQETKVTVSVGIAAFPEDAADAEELLRKADKAMYQAKEKGRNRVCCI